MEANIVALWSTEGEDDVGQYTSVSLTPARLHRKLIQVNEAAVSEPWYHY